MPTKFVSVATNTFSNYDFSATGTSESFVWSGEGRSLDRRNDNVLHYSSFIHGDLVVKLKDYVLIRNDDYSDAENLSNCYVAQVEDLFDSGEGEVDRHRAVVQWFFHIDELPPRHQKMLKEPDYRREIVKDGTKKYGATIDAETIFGKCSVIFVSADIMPYMVWERNDSSGLPMFVCRWEYTGHGFLPAKDNISDSLCSPCRPKPDILLSTPKSAPAAGRRKTLTTPLQERKENHEKSTDILSLSNLKISRSSKRKSVQRSHSVSKPKKVARNLEQSFSPNNENKFTKLQNKPSKLENGMHLIVDDIKNNEKPNSKRRINFSDSPIRDNLLTFKSPVSNKSLLTPKKTDETESPLFVTTKSGRKVKLRTKFSLLESPIKSPESEEKTPRKQVKRKLSMNEVENALSMLDDSEDDKEFDPKGLSESSSDEDEDYKDSDVLLKTPRNSKTTERHVKRASSAQKKKEMKRITFTLPERKHSISAPKTPLAEAIGRLHVSSVPERLPCREQEFQHVYSFIEGKLTDGTGGCMYIYGVPGTGKTATVLSVVSSLKRSVESGEIPDFNFIALNGMEMGSPHQCYVHILKALTGEKVTASKAEELLDKRFCSPHSKNEPVVLLVDELDILWTRKQNILYKLFDWPAQLNSRLIVLAIANTMNLLERLMMSRISSRLGVTRVPFLPYNNKQLQEIIMNRLEGLKAFDPDVILLAARKVAALLSGDVRRALNLCSRAAEIAETKATNLDKGYLVTMAHIEAALEEIFESPNIKLIQQASKHEKLFLQAVVADFKESGLEETTFSRVYRQYCTICHFMEIVPLNSTQVGHVFLTLHHYQLLSGGSCRYPDQKFRLNCSTDDVNFALKNARDDDDDAEDNL